MPMVFAGVCSHAPGITGRAERGDPVLRDGLCKGFERMRQAIEDSGAEALVVIGAEHFANFFMNNMPAFCIGMGETYTGPIEDEAWLGIKRTDIPGSPDLSKRPIPERSTRNGTGNFSTGSSITGAVNYCPIPMKKSIARPGRAGSKSAPLLRLPVRPKAPPERSGSTRLSRSSRSAVRSR